MRSREALHPSRRSRGRGRGTRRSPGGSCLADDELLQLFEIYEPDPGRDLAVLSACATGRGTAVAGEGVFALGRGFLARGARRVVASHWEVRRRADGDALRRVFEALPTPGADEDPSPNYAAALASAKRTVRNDPQTAAPFYWAPVRSSRGFQSGPTSRVQVRAATGVPAAFRPRTPCPRRACVLRACQVEAACSRATGSSHRSRSCSRRRWSRRTLRRS